MARPRSLELEPGEHFDPLFTPSKRFIRLDDAAKDGQRQLVKRGADYAVAVWTGDMWSYPFGPGDDEPDHAEQIDFDPTHYAPKDR